MGQSRDFLHVLQEAQLLQEAIAEYEQSLESIAEALEASPDEEELLEVWSDALCNFAAHTATCHRRRQPPPPAGFTNPRWHGPLLPLLTRPAAQGAA